MGELRFKLVEVLSPLLPVRRVRSFPAWQMPAETVTNGSNDGF